MDEESYAKNGLWNITFVHRSKYAWTVYFGWYIKIPKGINTKAKPVMEGYTQLQAHIPLPSIINIKKS